MLLPILITAIATPYILMGFFAWCAAIAYERFWFKVLTFIPCVFLWLPLIGFVLILGRLQKN